MPKKAPKNAFFFYMLEFKQQSENRGVRFRNGMSEVADAASQSWSTMTPQQKTRYDKMAKQTKTQGNDMGEKYTTQGVAFSILDKQKTEEQCKDTNMKKKIHETVQNSFLNNCIATQHYYFVAGNYFCKNLEGDYIPAEIALIKYNLQDGCLLKYHSYLNPIKLPMGYALTAKEHANDTHRLPLPPNALGENNWGTILRDIAKFIGSDVEEMPPIYTTSEQIPIMKSFFKQFCMDDDEDPNIFKVYSLPQLFFVLKQEACQYSLEGEQGFPSIHIAQTMIDIDQYDYRTGIACEYHEKEDVTKFCALSSVMRWGYIFADHICGDLGIELIPGVQVPVDADVKLAVTLKNELVDSKSCVSLKTDLSSIAQSNYTEPHTTRWSSSSMISDGTLTSVKTEPADSDYPQIGHKFSKNHIESRDPRNPWQTESEHSPEVENPWAMRNKQKLRLPSVRSYKFDNNKGGRGRGILVDPDTSTNSGLILGRGIIPK